MCIVYSINSSFQSSVKKKTHQAIHLDGFQTHNLCIARADVVPLDNRANQMVRGESE